MASKSTGNTKTVEPPAQISTLMPEIMAAMGAIPKRGYNKHLQCHYRRVDDVIDGLATALQKTGCTLDTEVITHELREHTEKVVPSGERNVARATVLLRVRFMAPDGSRVTKEGVGEGIDRTGGPAATAIAMSMAFKYALGLGMPIPFLELSDENAGSTIPPPQAPSGNVPQILPAMDGAVRTTHLQGAEPGPSVERLTDRCNAEQQAEIERLRKRLGMDACDLKRIVQKRGVETLAQLGVGQAQEIITNMTQLVTQKDADELFHQQAGDGPTSSAPLSTSTAPTECATPATGP